ncbi:hypothetical protein L2E82_51431 [Cichorium intybus]|nr:hypothetical protein L2E82_51431 [Cichorium intybus]
MTTTTSPSLRLPPPSSPRCFKQSRATAYIRRHGRTDKYFNAFSFQFHHHDLANINDNTGDWLEKHQSNTDMEFFRTIAAVKTVDDCSGSISVAYFMFLGSFTPWNILRGIMQCFESMNYDIEAECISQYA